MGSALQESRLYNRNLVLSLRNPTTTTTPTTKSLDIGTMHGSELDRAGEKFRSHKKYLFYKISKPDNCWGTPTRGEPVEPRSDSSMSLDLRTLNSQCQERQPTQEQTHENRIRNTNRGLRNLETINHKKIIGEPLTETGDAKEGKSEVPLLKQSGVHWPSTPPFNCTALDYIGLLKVRRNTLNAQRITIEMPTLTLENSLRISTSRTNQLKELRL